MNKDKVIKENCNLNITEEENGIRKIIVPKGIRFIGNWKEYNIVDFQLPHILNKKIPGCGFTEYCIRTTQTPLVLCSPRIMLLENKYEQHPEVFYYKNAVSDELSTDKDLTKFHKLPKEKTPEEKKLLGEKYKESIIDLENRLSDYLLKCSIKGIVPKILVTYDSFRHVKEYLEKRNLLERYYIVIDEFQSIFTDSRFKSSTELEFVNDLQNLDKVCYVSATPMIDEYLKQIDEFKNLPYFELDWVSEDYTRAIKPDLKVRVMKSISSKSEEIIKTYKEGKFEILTIVDQETGEIGEIISNEAVFYINSVSNICEVIKKNKLSPLECNILCARNYENNKKVRDAFNSVKRDLREEGIKVEWNVPKEIIGKVPLKGEINKMFTFCTRTVYLGADFYSKCARTFILSDANIDSLAVDISLDLPQILGRQRDLSNPWKNRAEFYYKTLREENALTREDFEKYLEKKINKTESLLRSYKDTRMDFDKHTLAETLEYVAKSANYRDQFVAVNCHSGKDIVPVFNNLVLVAEQRAFDIQQFDYKDRFTVFNTISEEGLASDETNYNISEFLDNFESLPNFYYRMKSICESHLSEIELGVVLDQIPLTYKQYYEVLGRDRCRALDYRKDKYEKYISDLKFNKESLANDIYLTFEVGKRYTRSNIKTTLQNLYKSLGYNKTPKANDLEEYFDIKEVKITVSGKQERGFEIVSKKEREEIE